MIERPLVSVIINCYNGEKYLREAIDSVFAQTYENWELVFWDNQSTDSTREIVESYKSDKIRYFYAPKHTPLGEARNLAVEKANGEYINFLDADDVWMPEQLSNQVRLLIPTKQEVIFTSFELIIERFCKKSPTLELFLYIKSRTINENDIYTELLKDNFIVFSSVLFNKEIFINVGGIDPELEQNEDYDILLKVAQLTNIGFDKEKDTLYRIHDDNHSDSNGMLGYYENEVIYSRLPFSDAKRKAILMNRARIEINNLLEIHSPRKFLLLFKALCEDRYVFFVLINKIKKKIASKLLMFNRSL